MSDAVAPSLTLERYAAISALIDAGKARDQVLAHAGMSEEAWSRERSAWLAAMAAQARSRQSTLQERFVAQRTESLDTLKAGGRVEVADGALLGLAAQAPPNAAPPNAAPPNAAPPNAAPPNETMSDDETSRARGRVLPFHAPSGTGSDANTAALPVSGTVLASDPVRSGETYDDPPPDLRDVGGPLPFVTPASDGVAAHDELGGTLDVEGSAVGATLPFVGDRARPTARKRRPIPDGALPFREAPEAPPRAVDPGPQDPLAGTVQLEDIAGGTASCLTLKQYASLSVEIEAAASSSDVLRRYGLDADGYEREQRIWARKFYEDKALYQRYEREVEAFESWLAQRRS